MHGFVGKHNVTLDEKYRWVVPAIFRKRAGLNVMTSDIWVLEGEGASLVFVPDSVFQEHLDQLENSELKPIDIAEYKEHLFSSASITKMDGQNRILLTPTMREHLQVDGEAPGGGGYEMKVVGSGYRFIMYRLDNYPEEGTRKADYKKSIEKIGSAKGITSLFS